MLLGLAHRPEACVRSGVGCRRSPSSRTGRCPERLAGGNNNEQSQETIISTTKRKEDREQRGQKRGGGRGSLLRRARLKVAHTSREKKRRGEERRGLGKGKRKPKGVPYIALTQESSNPNVLCTAKKRKNSLVNPRRDQTYDKWSLTAPRRLRTGFCRNPSQVLLCMKSNQSASIDSNPRKVKVDSRDHPAAKTRTFRERVT